VVTELCKIFGILFEIALQEAWQYFTKKNRRLHQTSKTTTTATDEKADLPKVSTKFFSVIF